MMILISILAHRNMTLENVNVVLKRILMSILAHLNMTAVCQYRYEYWRTTFTFTRLIFSRWLFPRWWNSYYVERIIIIFSKWWYSHSSDEHSLDDDNRMRIVLDDSPACCIWRTPGRLGYRPKKTKRLLYHCQKKTKTNNLMSVERRRLLHHLLVQGSRITYHSYHLMSAW